jgi:hypothetical protein
MTLCNWCNEKEVAKSLGYLWSCADCLFKCPTCKQDVTYEQGGTCCLACDACHMDGDTWLECPEGGDKE